MRNIILTILLMLIQSNIFAYPTIKGSIQLTNANGVLKKTDQLDFVVVNDRNHDSRMPVKSKDGRFEINLRNFDINDSVFFKFYNLNVEQPSGGILELKNEINMINIVVSKKPNTILIKSKSPTLLAKTKQNPSLYTNSEVVLPDYKKVYPVQALLTISRDEAFDNLGYLKSKGYEGAFLKVTRAPDNTVYYKVFVGKYPTEKQAITIKRAIRKRFKMHNRFKDAFVKRDFQP